MIKVGDLVKKCADNPFFYDDFGIVVGKTKTGKFKVYLDKKITIFSAHGENSWHKKGNFLGTKLLKKI